MGMLKKLKNFFTGAGNSLDLTAAEEEEQKRLKVLATLNSVVEAQPRSLTDYLFGRMSKEKPKVIKSKRRRAFWKTKSAMTGGVFLYKCEGRRLLEWANSVSQANAQAVRRQAERKMFGHVLKPLNAPPVGHRVFHVIERRGGDMYPVSLTPPSPPSPTPTPTPL